MSLSKLHDHPLKAQFTQKFTFPPLSRLTTSAKVRSMPLQWSPNRQGRQIKVHSLLILLMSEAICFHKDQKKINKMDFFFFTNFLPNRKAACSHQPGLRANVISYWIIFIDSSRGGNQFAPNKTQDNERHNNRMVQNPTPMTN